MARRVVSEPMEDNALGTLLENSEGESANLWEMVLPLIKHRWVILLVLSVSLLIGILYNLNATPIYEAQSMVVIRLFIPNKIIREKETDSPGYATNWFDFITKIRMVNSQPLLEMMTRNLVEQGALKKEIDEGGWSSMSDEEKDRWIAQKAGILKGGLTVVNPEETTFVQITYQSPDAILARDVVNSLADTVVEYNQTRSLNTMKESLSYLNQQLEDSRKRVAEAEEKLFKYRVEKKIFSTDVDRQLMASRRADLVTKLTGVQELRRELESKILQLDKLLQRKDYTKFTPVSEDDRILVDLNKDLVTAEIKYEQLLLSYQEKHPEVIKAAGEIRILKQKFEQELTRTRTGMEYNLNVVKTRERFLVETLAQTEEDAVASTEKDIDYVVLDREANSARELYRTLLGAVKEVSINTNNIMNNEIFVHQKARVPTLPIKPQKETDIIFALVIGLVLGGVYAFGREYLDQTIRHPDDVVRAVHLPVLSTVPLYSSKKQKEMNLPLHLTNYPKSLFAESITALRTYLNLKLPEEHPVSIMITSSAPREGKTLIASNLAISMALDGKKTLLIDADLHRPTLHKTFHLDKQIGLFDLIVEALNPRWSDLDLSTLSFGDFQHMIRLKQWSGTMKIQWDSLPSPLTISYKEGRPVGSNIKEWKERYTGPGGFPPPENPGFSLDESEIADLAIAEHAGEQALEFIDKYPRLQRSAYFIEVVAQNYIQPTDYKNLSVLTAGTNPKNPSEILGSDQMKILLHILRERYERIILDMPPAWPLSDVSVLSPQVDGVLWICRTGEIPRNMFTRNVRQIQQVQPNILGVVINAVDLQRDRYYYYGYSPYYYYSRYYRSSYYYEHTEGTHELESPLPPSLT
jgi:uncharacterized protein involved in exopolysaccharide biosynthesis/Mrp family chromosome partitioning ATPase